MPADQHCGDPACTSREGWQCEYLDATGRACGWWCREHTVFEQGAAWCRRHANTIKRHRSRAGSIGESKSLPALEDRAPNLVHLIVEDANEEVLAILRRKWGGWPGVHITTDQEIRYGHIKLSEVQWDQRGPILPRAAAWKRGWAVYSNQGYQCRITIAVASGPDALVQVAVDDAVVLEAVPDWISKRQPEITESNGNREAFRARIITAIRESMSAQVAKKGRDTEETRA